MPRLRPLGPALAVLLALLPAAAGAHTFDELDRTAQKNLQELMRAYLDPTVEFTWRARKNLLAAFDELGARDTDPIFPVRDLEFLTSLVYQGRHYLAEFDEKDFEREFSARTKKSGPYINVSSEDLRLTLMTPKDYPKGRARDRKIPRDPPFPVLVSLHDAKDFFANQDAPGEACLDRRWPRGDHKDLYERWILVAPGAPRGQFLEEDKSIRHRFVTSPLGELWRRYHVDFDRIVLEGGEAAAAVAATYPYVYAGLVLRDGPIEPALVPNYANLPVYVVGNPELAKQLEDAGHKKVTAGDGKDLDAWIEACHREVPSSFTWRQLRPDHEMANWVDLVSVDWQAPERTITVEHLDTEADPNTIKIDTQGVAEIAVFLSDRVVDLSRPVRFVLNGEAREPKTYEREFAQYFERNPDIRQSMYFGWLYSVFISQMRMPAPKEATPGGDGTATPTDEPTPPPQGSVADEAKAKALFDIAAKAEADGDVAKAIGLYEQVVAMAPTSYLPRAQARLDALRAGGGGTEDGEGGGGDGDSEGS